MSNHNKILISDDEIELNVNNEQQSQIIKLIDQKLAQLAENYRAERNFFRTMKKIYKQEIKAAKKNIRKRRDRNYGFATPEKVPDNIAKFINVPNGTLLPRTQVTKAIYNIIKKRKLRYKKDGRVLRADSEIKKLFNLSDEVNNVTDPKDKNGFTFYNIQSHIAKCYPKKKDKIK